MSFLSQAALVLVFLTLRAGTFSFVVKGKRYNATIVVTEHNVPLGHFTFAQALAAVKQIATASFPFDLKVRIGADDYALDVQPA